jgi:hypothetical protein
MVYLPHENGLKNSNSLGRGRGGVYRLELFSIRQSLASLTVPAYNKGMKRFIQSLMILIMFAPGLACAQFMNADQAPLMKAGAMQMANEMPCCPQSKAPHGIAFFKDCLKADLLHSHDAPVVKKVDMAKYSPAFAAPKAPVRAFAVSARYAARGPPDRLALEQHSLYLSTLRLRI